MKREERGGSLCPQYYENTVAWLWKFIFSTVYILALIPTEQFGSSTYTNEWNLLQIVGNFPSILAKFQFFYDCTFSELQTCFVSFSWNTFVQNIISSNIFQCLTFCDVILAVWSRFDLGNMYFSNLYDVSKIKNHVANPNQKNPTGPQNPTLANRLTCVYSKDVIVERLTGHLFEENIG